APTELNYAAMAISVFVRYIERIPTIKDLVKRLHHDIAFKINCGFLVYDEVPSEASYSRLLTKLSESNVLDKVKEKLVLQANKEGYIIDDTIAIDATHIEARDQTQPKQDKTISEPKKSGSKTKTERDEWLKEK